MGARVVLPFKDAKGLVAYAMAAYKQLGMVKGQAIQKVIQDLGHENINYVKPNQYEAFYRGVEALLRHPLGVDRKRTKNIVVFDNPDDGPVKLLNQVGWEVTKMRRNVGFPGQVVTLVKQVNYR